MDQSKLDFLQKDFIAKLKSLQADAAGSWGRMNGQQMVEHFIDAVELAYGKIPARLLTPPENLGKMQAFVLSDIPFKENTKNPLMGETPAPLKYPDMATAVAKLEGALKELVATFTAEPGKKAMNPFFGELDFAGQVHLLHKHAIHHLTQFKLYP
ncbi:DUF1569 domain-containing protein [Flavihumibacter rivuli]|uniref:DUF1569 domain-containing protein n=1 Tax=Flavihumibacter rivuli TaxID=2838156 RepID=UPI001BDEAC77|nr:DUF1569 domain-containing protein [Flavihumibacter rivuli]ULQ55751.1 DUF1569 domain-containing protein [Flavihumibacter rivuli]